MSAKSLLVRGGLRVAATCFGREFVNVSSTALIQYSTLRLCELEDGWLNALMRCYQLGYGASGSHEWGEGAHCPQHPFGKDGHIMLPLVEFEKAITLGLVPFCEICGCTLVLCYSDDYLRKRLVLELTRNNNQDPLVTLMIHSGQARSEVVGLCFGAIVDGQTLKRRIIRQRFSDDEDRGERELAVLLGRTGLQEKDGRLLFLDEFLILRGYRGLEAVRFLMRTIFAYAESQGVFKALFWTETKSNIYRLAIMMGFEPVLEVDGLVFLYTPDFRSLLQVAKYVDFKLVKRVFTFSSKLNRLERHTSGQD